MLRGFSEPLLHKHTTRSSIVFTAALDGSRKAVLSLILSESSADGLRFQLYKNRFAERTGLPLRVSTKSCPARRENRIYYSGADPEYEGFRGFVSGEADIDRSVDALRSSASDSRIAALGRGEAGVCDIATDRGSMAGRVGPPSPSCETLPPRFHAARLAGTRCSGSRST